MQSSNIMKKILGRQLSDVQKVQLVCCFMTLPLSVFSPSLEHASTPLVAHLSDYYFKSNLISSIKFYLMKQY